MDDRSVPDIRTPIPGPRARALLERKGKLEVFTIPSWVPVVWEEAHGAVVTDVDGNRYIDFSSGVSVMNVGHSHPAVVDCLAGQVARLTHCYFSLTEAQVEAMEALAGLLPPPLRRIVFTNTGAEGVEMAVKLARTYQEKTEIITFTGSFHGRTVLTRAMGGIGRIRQGFSPFPPGHILAPYPYCYRCPFDLERETCELRCLHYLDDLYNTASRYDVAAVVVEPFQGVAGSIVPPPGFLEGLRRFCDERELLLIYDEVQASFGRTGKMFAFEHDSFLPDMAILGKGIASGIPTSAVVMREGIAEALHKVGWPSTFAGNPVSCAAIVASIRALVRDDMVEKAARTGEYILARLEDMKARRPLIGDARGMGLSLAVEFVRDRETKEPAPEETAQIFEHVTRHGLIMLPPGGLCGNVLRITPPLAISKPLVDKGLDLLEDAIRAVDVQ